MDQFFPNNRRRSYQNFVANLSHLQTEYSILAMYDTEEAESWFKVRKRQLQSYSFLAKRISEQIESMPILQICNEVQPQQGSLCSFIVFTQKANKRINSMYLEVQMKRKQTNSQDQNKQIKELYNIIKNIRILIKKIQRKIKYQRKYQAIKISLRKAYCESRETLLSLKDRDLNTLDKTLNAKSQIEKTRKQILKDQKDLGFLKAQFKSVQQTNIALINIQISQIENKLQILYNVDKHSNEIPEVKQKVAEFYKQLQKQYEFMNQILNLLNLQQKIILEVQQIINQIDKIIRNYQNKNQIKKRTKSKIIKNKSLSLPKKADNKLSKQQINNRKRKSKQHYHKMNEQIKRRSPQVRQFDYRSQKRISLHQQEEQAQHNVQFLSFIQRIQLKSKLDEGQKQQSNLQALNIIESSLKRDQKSNEENSKLIKDKKKKLLIRKREMQEKNEQEQERQQQEEAMNMSMDEQFDERSKQMTLLIRENEKNKKRRAQFFNSTSKKMPSPDKYLFSSQQRNQN